MGRRLAALEETDTETLRFTRWSIHRRALMQTSGAAGSGRSWSPWRTASGVSRRRAPGGHHGARPTALELERWTSRTAGQSLSTTCRVQTTNGSVDWMHG